MYQLVNMNNTNIHQKPRCKFFVSLAKALPVILVYMLLVYSYYGYIYQLCIVTVQNAFERLIYVFVYHVLLTLLVWSYWQTVFTEVGVVPKIFKLPEELLEVFRTANNEETKLQAIEKHGNSLPIITRTFVCGRRTFRYCILCNQLKPDRAHHCRICGVCVLKMDHHCPWVNNCISYTNYKYFLLFQFYALFFCIFIAITVFPYFLSMWQGHFSNDGKIHILFVFVIAVMFVVCLISIFSYHLYLTSYNRTTLEGFRAPIFESGTADRHGFDLGLVNNFKQVFGDKYILWPLPVFTSLGDGVKFPRRITPDQEGLLQQNGGPGLSWDSDDDDDNDTPNTKWFHYGEPFHMV